MIYHDLLFNTSEISQVVLVIYQCARGAHFLTHVTNAGMVAFRFADGSLSQKPSRLLTKFPTSGFPKTLLLLMLAFERDLNP